MLNRIVSVWPTLPKIHAAGNSGFDRRVIALAGQKFRLGKRHCCLCPGPSILKSQHDSFETGQGRHPPSPAI